MSLRLIEGGKHILGLQNHCVSPENSNNQWRELLISHKLIILNNSDVLIVRAGPAGCSAAIFCAQINLRLH